MPAPVNVKPRTHSAPPATHDEAPSHGACSQGTRMSITKPLSRVAAVTLLSCIGFQAGAADTEFNPVAREPRTAVDDGTAGVIFKLRGDTSTAKLSTGADR